MKRVQKQNGVRHRVCHTDPAKIVDLVTRWPVTRRPGSNTAGSKTALKVNPTTNYTYQKQQEETQLSLTTARRICAICGSLWCWKHWSVRQIKAAQLAFGRTLI